MRVLSSGTVVCRTSSVKRQILRPFVKKFQDMGSGNMSSPPRTQKKKTPPPSGNYGINPMEGGNSNRTMMDDCRLLCTTTP
ncbi:hypothetical protein TNCV_867071 [Trichonephila clavipes]|nr:hypothetical protein TNCV_867071 [Trichonephila clavipes]